jgi:hypothetical protein
MRSVLGSCLQTLSSSTGIPAASNRPLWPTISSGKLCRESWKKKDDGSQQERKIGKVLWPLSGRPNNRTFPRRVETECQRERIERNKESISGYPKKGRWTMLSFYRFISSLSTLQELHHGLKASSLLEFLSLGL